MVYILTSTKTILKTEVRAQESRARDNVVEGLLALKLKSQLLAESYDEQQSYVNSAAIASYISLNKLEQRNRYRASVSIQSITGNDYSFTKGSSSSGLGYALALFESWWNVVLKKPSQFACPVFATGEILTSGTVNKISHLSEKLDAVCTYVENNKESFQQFYICFPMGNDDEVSDSTREDITKLGGILLPVNRLQELLATLLGNDYDGDPLGRWEPFKGLNSFDYEDSVRFFGRDKDVTRLYDDLKKNNGLLIVAGASGSGKSSLIKAGLIPRLEQEGNLNHWAYTTPTKAVSENGILGFILDQCSITWGLVEQGVVVDDLVSRFNVSIEEGIAHLQPYITDQEKRCLLYFDQYEEVFSQSNQDIHSITRDLKLIDALARQFESMDIVLALRNEYLGRLLDNHALSSPVISNIASQISPDGWQAIVHEQAQFSGINFETDEAGNALDKAIIEQALGTQYALPMVEFLLEQLYRKATKGKPNSNTLKFEHYNEMGGLSGAIAYRAQQLINDNKANDRLVAQLFDTFVGLNGESLPYGRQVDLKQLSTSDSRLYHLVLGFIDANLIVSLRNEKNEQIVKLAHDSLFSNWDQLSSWIESFKDYLQWRYSIDGQYNRWSKNQNIKNVYLLKDKELLKEGKRYQKNKIITNADINRYLQDSKKQRAKSFLNIAFWFFVLPTIVASFYYWDHSRLKIYTYEEIAKKWEVPFGINEINSAQIEKRNYHYSLEYQGGRLKKVKKLNGVGNLYGQSLEDEVALWEYTYTDTDKVNEVRLITRSGKTSEVHYYQFSSENSAVLRFSKSIESVGFFNGSSRDQFGLRLQKGKSKVSRKLLKFYENGFLKKISYQDPYGMNTTDKGHYGRVYLYNNEGLITKTTDLNKEHEQITSSQITYLYDLNKRKVSESKGQEGNLFEQRFTRNSWGNVIEQSFFYRLEPTTNNGIHKYKFLYDQQGFLIEKQKLGINDELVAEQVGSVAKAKYKYDGNGNLAEISYFGTNNQLIYDQISGFSLGKFKFNDKNQLKETSSFGVLKEPILRSTAKLSNVFNNKYEYDSQGNRGSESYFGIKGESILASNGAHKIVSKYNQYDQLIEQSIYGVDNKPALGASGFFMKKFEYDSQGNLIKDSSFGIKEEPIINMQGYHAATNKYDEKGNVIEEATYNAQGSLMLSRNGIAVLRMKHDDFGNTIETSFYDQFYKPALDKEGISRLVMNYEGGESIGRISGFEYYGTSGEPVLNAVGVHRSVQRFDSEGRTTEWENYGINNELVIKAGESFTSSTATFYSNGKQKRVRSYYKDGSYNQLINDIRGNALSFSFYDKNHNPILGPGNFSTFSESITNYDEFGNPIRTEFIDEKGNPATNKPGYTKKIFLKDKNGFLTHKYFAYDISGNIIRGFNTKIKKLKNEEEDKRLWEYLKSLNTKDAFKLYLDLVENGLYKEDAVSELLKFNSKISIECLVEGGKILLNGKYIGFHRVTVYLKPGEYEVTIKSKGYRTYKKNIAIKDSDSVDLSKKLEKDSSSWDKNTLILEAGQGYAEAQKNLGNKYLQEGDFTEAMSWYLKAAGQGYSPAIHNIGYLYETAKGVKKDLKEAYEWYLKAAKNGFDVSQWRVAKALYDGDLAAKDYQHSMSYFVRSAEQGYAASLQRLGLHYFLTRAQANRPSIESIKAFNYFKLASLQGTKEAYKLLGLMYGGCLITDYDVDKVTSLYEKAFNENNDEQAAIFMGEIYSSGIGTDIDFDKAIFWYEKAALKGNVYATSALYKIYFEGTTFFKNREKGLFWLQKAAEMGDAHAIKNLKVIQRGGKYRY